MAWLPSHQELVRHPKVRRLARVLDVSVPAAIGHLHCLWWWAMDFASDGNVSEYQPDEIADAALWDGDCGDLYNALIACGWIDKRELMVDEEIGYSDIFYFLHDWDEYAGRYLDQKVQNRERQRRFRERKRDANATPTPPVTDDNAHVTVTSPSRNAPREDKRREEEIREQERNVEPRAVAPPVVVSDTPFSIFVTFLDEIGTSEDDVAPAWKKKQLGIAKQLVEQGYGDDKVRRCTRFMRSQSWRSPFDLSGVAGYIGTWEANGQPDIDQPRGSPRMSAEEARKTQNLQVLSNYVQQRKAINHD